MTQAPEVPHADAVPPYLVPASPVLSPYSGEPHEYPAGSWDLLPSASRYLRDALDEVRLGETFWFMVGHSAVPGPDGRPVTGLLITIYGKSPLVGQPPIAEGAFQVGFPTRAEMADVVRVLVDKLRNQARDMLTSRRP